jgi:class 3 adenylate cyclase
MDVSNWLQSQGFGQYTELFADNAIDRKALVELRDRHLKELGLPLGHRLKLLKAIRELREPEGTPVAGRFASRAGAAERRQLTVLFCDLVGSTELATALDPEVLGEVMRAYTAACEDVVCRAKGHPAGCFGDGVLAYFGLPRAQEHDAERAVRAGLQLVQAVARLETRAGVRLQARVGIATGLVVTDKSVVSGDTPHLAARLQELAEPGSVVISEATRRLVGRLFAVIDLGPQRLKGFAEPLSAFRVEGEGRAEGRFEALHGEHLTPLVGREKELGRLLERWAWAKDGDGQVVLLSGEPGIGKSRLIRALRERLGDEPHALLSLHCSPHHTNSALYPVIDLLERVARLDRAAPL